jgi:hypothetical protein
MRTFCKYMAVLFFSVTVATATAQQLFYLEPSVAASITAATYDPSKKAVMFFSGSNVFYYPVGSNTTVKPEWYNIDGFKPVDAAVEWDNDNALLFNGSTYRMFKHSTSAFASAEASWPSFPASWNNKLDGAVNWDKDILFFFYKKEYIIYSTATDSVIDHNDITTWNGWPQQWTTGIDDAFNIGDGFIYFLHKGEIMPYSLNDKSFYNPRPITAAVQSQSTGQATNALRPVSAPQAPSNNQQQNTNTGFADGACVTGAPSGSGLKEIQSPIEGDQEARLYYDNLPKGFRVAEIKIYTSKVWGKSVICGLQTILQSPSKLRIEQPVLGKKTLTENVFTLEDDECITGISGTKNGESGNFIYSLQISTSNRTSPLYGERATEKGRENFTLAVSEAGIFNGFMGNFNINMTGIGIKYYGQQNTSQPVVQVQGSTPQVSASVNIYTQGGDNSGPVVNNNNASTNNTTQGIVDEYLDNYVERELSYNVKTEVQQMPGLDWLGAGFDILRFDPLFPNETKNRKIFRAIVLTNSPERGGTEAQYLLPYGTLFGSVNSGNNIDTSGWIGSYKEYASSFSVNASGKVGVPNMASGSLSGSYEESSSANLGSKIIYHFQKIVKKIHELDLELLWRDKNSGQKYKQKIHPSFKEDVAALPVMAGPVPSLSVFDMKRNQPLSSSLEAIKNQYYSFIAKYGTHFTNHVAWGGQYVVRNIANQSDYAASKSSKTEWKASAEATIKKVKVEGEVGGGNSQSMSSSNGKQQFKQQVYVQGGKGETDQNKWEDKVDLSPAPIEMAFTSMADLLCKELFPTEKEIEKKSALLKLFTEKYLVDNMRVPVESKDDFFNVPDLLMPGNISIRNDGGYVMKFTITFDLNGQMQTKTTGTYPIGKTEHIEIPADAKNIKLKAELYTGWLSDTKVIFEKTYTRPELKCYKVWGTVFNASYGECEQ